MGLIRKTLSISTLGLVGWRSKKELLRDAEAERDAARADLEHSSRRQGKLLEKLAEAEARAAEAEKAVRKSARRRGSTRDRVTAKSHGLLDSVRETVEPVVDSTEKKGRRARKRAIKRSAELRASTEKTGRRARKSAAKRTAELRAQARKGRDTVSHVVDDAAATVKKTAADLTNR